jgi:hypothetical protein
MASAPVGIAKTKRKRPSGEHNPSKADLYQKIDRT